MGKKDWELLKKEQKDSIIHEFCIQEKFEPLLILNGKGCWVFDEFGNKYLDFVSNMYNISLGYQNSEIINTIINQTKVLCNTNNANLPEIELVKRLKNLLGNGYQKFFFSTSGSQAIETAIKLCRLLTGRKKIISFLYSYHGTTLGAANCSGIPELVNPFGERTVSAINVPPPYCFRCFFGKKIETCDLECLKYINRIIELEDPDTIAGFIYEPINWYIGFGMIENFWKGFQEIITKYNLISIADEIVTGFGRLGCFFAKDLYGLTPDIIVSSKSLTNGYLPLAFTAINRGLSNILNKIYLPYGFTYMSYPLGCQTAIGTIDYICNNKIFSRVKLLEPYLKTKLYELKKKHSIIGDVRGKGFLWVLELVDKKNFPIDEELSEEIYYECRRKGLLIDVSEPHIMIICPPLIINKEELNHGISILDEIFNHYKNYKV